MTAFLLLLLACPKTAETVEEDVSPSLPATHVQATVPVGTVPDGKAQESGLERDRILAVLQSTAGPALDCYTAALAGQPDLFGEMRVRIQISKEGTVEEVRSTYSTVHSSDLDSCVVEVVKELTFPAPSAERALAVSYPFLFTSDLTPANVVRALRIRNGLLDPTQEAVSDEPNAEQVAGEEGWWTAW